MLFGAMLRLQASRQLAVSPVATASSPTLVQALSDEIEHEQKEYSEPEALQKKPPFAFELFDTPGSPLLELRRLGQNETVSVEIDVEAPEAQPEYPSDEDDAESEAEDTSSGQGVSSPTIPFTATIEKQLKRLVFSCATDGTELDVRRVLHEAERAPADDEAETEQNLNTLGVYSDNSSASFYELDDRLQTALTAYLATRGIDSSMLEYIAALYDSKEQRQYMRWLQQTYDFVKEDEPQP